MGFANFSILVHMVQAEQCREALAGRLEEAIVVTVSILLFWGQTKCFYF